MTKKTKLDAAEELAESEVSRLVTSVKNQLAMQGIDPDYAMVALTTTFARAAGELVAICETVDHAERRALAAFYDSMACVTEAEGRVRGARLTEDL